MRLLWIVAIGVAALLAERAARASSGSAGDASSSQLPADASSLGALVASAGAHLVATVKTLWTIPAAGYPYAEAIATAEQKYAIPENLLARQLDIESDHFNPDVVSGNRLSAAGAIGIAQFEPATAAELGVDPYDPFSSIDGAGRMMHRLYQKFGSWSAALAAYNWGEGNVARKGLAAAPAETVAYIQKIAGEIGVS